MSSLMERLAKAGAANTLSGQLSKSVFFKDKDQIPTHVPIINVALSSHLDGGLQAGITMLAGPSKHFKSALGLVMVGAYLKKYPDAICMFFDSEFGCSPEYFAANGIDSDRVLHVPIEHIEQLKFDMVKRLEEVKRGDRVIVFIDSIGNLASKKEVEDALNENAAADMTRAKQLKSLFRIITPHFTMKDIPCVVINHTYKEIALFPKDIVGGGTGSYYSADTIFIIGRQQEKEGTEIVGWNFVLNIEKSRKVREKAKCTFQVTYEGGIFKWSGMLDEAMEYGVVTSPSKGWFQLVDKSTGELLGNKMRAKDLISDEFWEPIVNDPGFKRFVRAKYSITQQEPHSEELAPSV